LLQLTEHNIVNTLKNSQKLPNEIRAAVKLVWAWAVPKWRSLTDLCNQLTG